MKKITSTKLLLMFLIVITFILMSNIFGYSYSNYKPKYGITTARVNFRRFANTESSTIVKTLPINTKLKIMGETNGFYIVELTDSSIGAVASKYVKIEGTSLPQAKVYENLKKYYATVNVTRAVVRGGPSTSYSIYYQLVKGATVEVIGRIDNFSMIVSKNNLIGMVRSDLLTPISSNTTNNTTSSPPKSNLSVTENNTPKISTVNENIALKDELLKLINNARKSNNLNELAKDNSLYDAAQIKSDDMNKNNYFSHTSPTYGTPFELMRDLGISYKSAGENIAGNSDITAAFNSWMNSENHKKNILSTSYNYIGLGITKSKDYGYLICAMFIGK